MATLPVGYGRCTILFRPAGSVRDMMITFDYDPGTTDPAAHVVSLNSAFKAAARPGNPSAYSNQYQYRGMMVTEMDDTGPIQANAAETILGSAAIQPAPANCAILIQKRTAAGGRRNRGRLFVPPIQIAEAAIDAAGNLDSTARNSVQGVWNSFFEDCAGLNLPWVLCHSEPPFTPTPITSLNTQTLMATQRRRMRR